MGFWYKDFYNTSAGGEAAMRVALHDADPKIAAENRADIEMRLREVATIPEERCVISSEQRRFLRRMLDEQ